MSLKALLRSQKRGERLLPVIMKYLAKELVDLNSGKITKHDIEITDALMSIRCFEERIKSRQVELPDEKDYFHPSALGQCIRKLWFQAKNAPMNHEGRKDTDDVLKMHLILETGTYFHILIQNLCEKAGILVKREVPIISSKYQTIGTADGILKIDQKYLLEIKTINPRDFAKLQHPLLGHKRQAHAYMKCLELNSAIILYCDKGGSNNLKEFVLPFDETFYKSDVSDRIHWHFRNVHHNILPPREGTHPKLFPCNYCQYTHICFGTEELNDFMQTLKKLPKKIRLRLKR